MTGTGTARRGRAARGSEGTTAAGAARGVHRRLLRRAWVTRLGLMAGTALATTAAWTGAPLFALWVGSQADNGAQPAMVAVFIVIGVLAVLEFGLVILLSALNRRWERAAGVRPQTRRPPPWYSSMRGERDVDVIRHRGVSGPEKVVAVCCATALIAFEIWFFFFSGSSLPSS
jgi:hypothetical protein